MDKSSISRAALLTAVLAVLEIVIAEDVCRNYIEVLTPQCGNIRGLKLQLESGKEVYEFHNIPYAQAPVGALRFKPTRELETGKCTKRGGTIDGTDNVANIECIQSSNGEGTEDCLVMTIRSTDLRATKPVILWIHGGGLSEGNNHESGNYFDSEITASLDVVTVNVNYRLGYLGFGAFEEVQDPQEGNYGNNGIRDQVTALKWIQTNIRSFGGNPNSVTIIGESGGGTSVLALLSSPLANNLFHNAISLSPAPEFRFDHIAGDALQRDVLVPLGCTQKTLQERKQCLMDLPANKFSAPFLKGLGLGKPWNVGGYFDFPMRNGEDNEMIGLVTVDPSVVTFAPKDLNTAKFSPRSKVNVVISNLAHEVAIVSEIGSKIIPDWTQTVFKTFDAVNATLDPLFKVLKQKCDILEEVYKIYPNLTPQLLWDTLVTDIRSTCPINTLSEKMSISSHHNIYRLYITNTMQNEPKLSSFHIYDTWALFGFKKFTLMPEHYEPGERDMRFRGLLEDVIRKFTHGDKNKFRGWKMYPGGNTLVLGNDGIGYETLLQQPQTRQCAKLDQLELTKYGNQN